MSDVFEVLGGGEFYVDAGSLKDDTNLLAQSSGILRRVEAHDDSATASGKHQRGEDTEHRGFATAVRTKQSEDLGRENIEGNAIERLAIAIGMAEILHGDDTTSSLGAGFGNCCWIGNNAQKLLIYWRAAF